MPSRRRFGALLAAGLATGLAAASVATFARGANTKSDNASPRRLVRPPRLKPGATVGLIAPGGVVDDAIIQTCVKNLESLGFKVKPGANIRATRGGYAGTITQRVDDLHSMFLNRDVQAIWAARGGSGCTGLLPHLHYAMIRRHPKILIGYSDITALHLALYRHAGLVTFHGPVGWSTFSDYSVNHMLSVLMEPQREYTIHMSIENERQAAKKPQFALRTLRAGVAEGRLIGGNLATLCTLIGTPYAADISRALLFLEEISEAPYRVDRLLTQLDQSAGLQNTAGAILGVFERTTPPDNEPSLTLEAVIDDHFATLKTPSVYGYSFGHIAHQFTLPVGVRARLDTRDQTLTLLEAAVTD